MQLAQWPIKIFGIIPWLIAICIALPTSAQTTSQNSQKLRTKVSVPVKTPSAITSIVAMSYSQSMIDHEDGTLQRSWLVLPRLNARLTERLSLQGQIGFEQDLSDTGSTEDGVTDFKLSLLHGPHSLASWLNGAWSFSGVVPASEYSTQELNLQTTLSTGYNFSLNPRLVPGFEAALGIGVLRNFHEFETSTSGAVLNPYGIRESLSTSYRYRKWTISFDLISRHAFSYNNEVSQNFEHSQEVSYALMPAWGLAIGHTNSGNWLKDNQQDLNLKLIDEDDSIVYAMTRFTF